MRSHNNYLNVSATQVNYFYTTVPEFYLRGLDEQPVDEEKEEEELESLTRGLDQEEAREKEAMFELNSSSVSSFSPASYASYHPETNQCRNIVLEARQVLSFLFPVTMKYMMIIFLAIPIS